MPYGVDVQGAMEFFREADAVVPDAEAKLRRIPILKTLDVALASDEQACQGMQNPESGWLIDRSHAGQPWLVHSNGYFLAQDQASVWTLPKQKCAVFLGRNVNRRMDVAAQLSGSSNRPRSPAESSFMGREEGVQLALAVAKQRLCRPKWRHQTEAEFYPCVRNPRLQARTRLALLRGICLHRGAAPAIPLMRRRHDVQRRSPVRRRRAHLRWREQKDQACSREGRQPQRPG